MKKLGLLSIIAVAAVSAYAPVIDFEDQTPGSFSNNYAPLTISYSNTTVSLNITDADSLIGNMSDNVLHSTPFSAVGHYRFDIAGGATSFGAVVGDFGGDEDTITMEAYNAANALIDSDGYVNAAGNTVAQALSVSGAISYVLVKGVGVNGEESLYLDNVRYEAVPEPATMIALGLGAAALIRRRKK